MIKIKRLVWDSWNTQHIKKHSVLKFEVEQAVEKSIRVFQTYNKRLLLIGKTNKHRLLTVILVFIKKGYYYVVTARDTSKKERRLINI